MMMDPLWSETCWSTFKYFIILTVSTYYIFRISWIIKCLIILDARWKHEDYQNGAFVDSFPLWYIGNPTLSSCCFCLATECPARLFCVCGSNSGIYVLLFQHARRPYCSVPTSFHWLEQWGIKVNPNNSAKVTFTTRRDTCPPVNLHNTPIPVKTEVKYLELHLDEKLMWKTHIKAKRCQMELKLKNMSWLINARSQLSLDSKLTVFKTILLPIWTYRIELWGCSKPSNTKILQTFQWKMLRMISRAPWYCTSPTKPCTVTSKSRTLRKWLESTPTNTKTAALSTVISWSELSSTPQSTDDSNDYGRKT